ncbi:MAG: nucleoside monophosphate kinase [Promethearchaeota archaeon]|nr:MAG: nucleoside monophosphate kinase [Candidatus Lokiarchaeota archaeon]
MPTHIIIFGPPGSGKGTFSGRLTNIFPQFEHISTGDIFRENLKNETPLGKKAKEYMEKGELVPNSLTNDLVKDKLEQIEEKSWILDGYPRNMNQVEFLDKHAKIDLFLLLEVPRDVIKKRILGRFSCPECGEIYNKYTLQPEKKIGNEKWICDKCGAEIEFRQRSDDSEETLNNRLDVYEENAEPIIQHYKEKDKLKKIDAEDTLELTEKELKDILEI